MKNGTLIVEPQVILEWLAKRFPEQKPVDFYRDLFPVGSFEMAGVFENGKYNGIIIEIKKNGRVNRHTLTDDLNKIKEVMSRDNFCLMSPISYIGKTRHNKNARELYAIAIDLDGVKTENGFNFLMAQIEHGEEMMAFVWGLPKPTYIVFSGTGIHLYYVLKNPIRLFPNVITELERLKKRLTWQAWTQGASELYDNVQYESLFQGFRVVGTKTKKETRARAFCVGKKVTIDYLNKFVPEEFRAKRVEQEITYTSNLSLEDAKKKYPEWYQKRVVEGVPRSTWRCKRDLYEWWKRRIMHGAVQGHRYWCVMILAVYAKKSSVEYEDLLADAVGMIDFLDSVGDGSDPFTKADVMDALRAYDDAYLTYPIKAIVARTGIRIEKNKRNGRKRIDHITRLNRIFDLDKDNGEPEKRGRPRGSGTKREKILFYATNHPEANHSEIARALGISRPTVIKWLREE